MSVRNVGLILLLFWLHERSLALEPIPQDCQNLLTLPSSLTHPVYSSEIQKHFSRPHHFPLFFIRKALQSHYLESKKNRWARLRSLWKQIPSSPLSQVTIELLSENKELPFTSDSEVQSLQVSLLNFAQMVLGDSGENLIHSGILSSFRIGTKPERTPNYYLKSYPAAGGMLGGPLTDLPQPIAEKLLEESWKLGLGLSPTLSAHGTKNVYVSRIKINVPSHLSKSLWDQIVIESGAENSLHRLGKSVQKSTFNLIVELENPTALGEVARANLTLKFLQWGSQRVVFICSD